MTADYADRLRADLAVLHPLADACPSCHPGDHPAVLPEGDPVDDGGSLRATYRCPVCGMVWVCSWDAASVSWPCRDPLPVGALVVGFLGLLLARQAARCPDCHPETARSA
jgi:hypothetical protein